MRKAEKQWSEIHSVYKTTNLLGQGTYGIVYEAEKLGSEGGKRVALKRSRLDIHTENGIPETALREIALLRDLKHENIVGLHEISCNTSRLYMVCELLDMDLKKFIRTRNRNISLPIVKHITYETLKGLAYCHGHRVLHRDLKPHNILVDKEAKHVKLADFGLARASHAVGKPLTHEVVTLWYRAPELLLGHTHYDDSVDIWSMGCIIAELLSGKPLFPGDSEIDTLFRIFRFMGTPTPSEWPQNAVIPHSSLPKFPPKDAFAELGTRLDNDGAKLLGRMLQYDPSRRLTAREALRSSWFDELRVPKAPADEPRAATLRIRRSLSRKGGGTFDPNSRSTSTCSLGSKTSRSLVAGERTQSATFMTPRNDEDVEMTPTDGAASTVSLQAAYTGDLSSTSSCIQRNEDSMKATLWGTVEPPSKRMHVKALR